MAYKDPLVDQLKVFRDSIRASEVELLEELTAFSRKHPENETALEFVKSLELELEIPKEDDAPEEETVCDR